jgi:immune inhibitor A
MQRMRLRTLSLMLLLVILAACAAAPPAQAPTASAVMPPAGVAATELPTAAPPPLPSPVLPPATARPLTDAEALAAAAAPPRDAVALAEAFGRCAVPCVRTSDRPAAEPTAGSQAEFSLIDFSTNERYTVTAELRYVGPVLLMYVELGQDVDQRDLVAAAQQFEAELYPRLRTLFGNEQSPGVDAEPRITVLNARDRSGAVLGYFSADDSLPRSVAPFSNEREMFVQNIAQLNPAGVQYLSVLVHEFQHLLHQSQQPAAATWFNEGLSQLAEDLTGFGQDGLILSYLSRPDTGLTDWGHGPGASLAHYGASRLFLRYLRSHYLSEADLLPLLRADAGHQPERFVELARRVRPDRTSFADLVGDWAVANLVNDAALADGRYSYRADGYVPQPLPRPMTPRRIEAEWQEDVQQFGVDYLRLPAGSRLEFRGAADVGLVAEDPLDRAAWFARRGDERTATLTRPLDLRGVTTATLELSLWYELENDYDFAYVTVSDDDGRSWQPLSNAVTRSGDRFGRHFDGALNGVSGRPDARIGSGERGTRQDLQFDLSAYVGRTVTLRIWVVTDEAVNAPGLMIDRIAVPQIGYDDPAVEDGVWQAEGFARVSGRLPQEWRLYLVADDDGRSEVRVLTPAADGSVAAVLDADRDYTLVVVAATPYTTEAAPYRISVLP